MKERVSGSVTADVNVPVRLSGTLNGVKYRLGVPNPLNGRNPAPLDERHLPVLRALLSFLKRSTLSDRFRISEVEFTRSCPAEDAWSLLGTLLTCWARTDIASTTVDFLFASVLFGMAHGGQIVFVTLSQHIIPVIEGMIDAGSSTMQNHPKGNQVGDHAV